MSHTPHQTGLSLVELLIAVALTAMLLAPLTAILRGGAAASASVGEQTELQSQAQFAMQRMVARVQATPSALLPAKADDTSSGTWLAPALYDLRANADGTLALNETIGGVSRVIAEPATSLSITSPPVSTGRTLVVIALTLGGNNVSVSLRETARLGGYQ
jgi:Tfp pilus assembly protein PilV